MNTRETLGAEQWCAKGTEAMNARNWDYAIECLSNAVRLSPENLLYRRLKYRSCRKNLKSGDGTKSPVKLVDVRRKLLQARLTKNWAGVDKWAEAGISLQPWDAQFFAHVAIANTEMQNRDVARYAWILAIKLDRNNAAYNRAFGRFLCIDKDFDGAEQCYRRILEVEPEDRHALEMLRYIDVERLMHREGYSSASSTHDVKAVNEIPEPAAEQPDFTLDQAGVFDLTDPSSAKPAGQSAERQKTNHLKIAQLCAEQRQWQKSLDAYRKALELAPEDTHIREMMENTELAMLREHVDQLKRAAVQKAGSQKLQIEAMDHERRLLDRRIQIYTERVERYRNDMQLKLELAEDYARIGEYRKAIPLYQQACQHSGLREQALLKLGQCWICDGKRDLAIRQFTMALKLLSPLENPESWKTAHYWLGRLHESEGRTSEATSHYSEVLLLDYDFRDTAARLESLQNGSASAVPQDA